MILSIDTFSEILGICLLDEKKKVVFHVEYSKLKPFSETIIEEISYQLGKLKIDKKQLTKIVVNKGPGSYTGLRVGVITAKTLAYSLNIPIFAYTSLDAMYYPYKGCNVKTLCVINAGKNEVYVKSFNEELFSDISIIKIDDLHDIVYRYDLIVEKNIGLDGSIKLNKSLCLDGALLSIEENKEEDVFTLEPVYIRKS